MKPPLGFVYDDSGRIVFDPDQQVQRAVRLLFEDLSPHRFRDACCSSLQDGGRSLAAAYQQGRARRRTSVWSPGAQPCVGYSAQPPLHTELSSSGQPDSAKCASGGNFATVV